MKSSPPPKPRDPKAEAQRAEDAKKIALGFGYLLLVSGWVTILVCQFILILSAFGKGALWGLGILFVPAITVLYTVRFWSEAKYIAAVYFLLGLPMLFGGMYLTG